jgi:hypothetical protein
MENNTMMPNEETLKKIAGDPTDEVPEAAYRLAATGFVKAVAPTAIKSLMKDGAFKTYLNDHEQIGEFFVGFVLAVVLELIPIEGLDDQRKRLAYNLRVRSYEEIGELGASYIHLGALPDLRRFIKEEAQNAIRLATGDLIKEEFERAVSSDKTPPIKEEIEPAMPAAKGDVEPAVQAVSDGREAVEGKRRSK